MAFDDAEVRPGMIDAGSSFGLAFGSPEAGEVARAIVRLNQGPQQEWIPIPAATLAAAIPLGHEVGLRELLGCRVVTMSGGMIRVTTEFADTCYLFAPADTVPGRRRRRR